MATLKPAKGKKPAAPAKAKAAPKAKSAKAAEPSKDVTGELVEEIPASLSLTETGAEFAPGISLMPSLQIIRQLAPFKQRVTELKAMAARAVIDSPEKYEKGLTYLNLVKSNSTQIETYRKAVKGPIDDYGKYIQSLFKPMLDELEAECRVVVSGRMLKYKQEQDRIAQEAADKLRREQQEAAQRLIDEEKQKGNVEVAEAMQEAVAAAPAPVVQSAVSTISAGGVRAATRKTWKGAVSNPMEVLKGILEGRVPINVIGDWSSRNLDAYAKTISVEGTHNGITCAEVESLGVRGG